MRQDHSTADAMRHDTASIEVVTELVAELAQRVQAEIESGSMTAERARELSAQAARLHHAAEAVHVLSAGAVHTTDVRRYDAESTTRRWLARHNGLSHRDASRLTRVSDVRTTFTDFGRAFIEGEVTLGHVDALTRIIPDRFRGADRVRAIEMVVEVQEVLLAEAKRLTVDEFADLCRRVRARLDGDGPPDPGAEASRVWLVRLFNGRWALSGDLTPDDGAMLASILQDRLDARRPSETSESPESSDSPGSPESSDVVSERRADALRDLLLAGSGAAKPGRVGIYLHIELDDLNAPADEPLSAILGRLIDGNGVPHTDAGLDLTDDTLWGLMAGADVTPVYRATGRNLFYGRTRRLAPDILRRVIAHRDRRCRWPGCANSGSRVEAHHIEEWDAGGTTDPRNCGGHCLPHHHDHHDRGWRISGDADATLTYTRPDGRPFDPTPWYRALRPAVCSALCPATCPSGAPG